MTGNDHYGYLSGESIDVLVTIILDQGSHPPELLEAAKAELRSRNPSEADIYYALKRSEVAQPVEKRKVLYLRKIKFFLIMLAVLFTAVPILYLIITIITGSR